MSVKKRILVIDDDADILDTVSLGLELAGFAVVTAADGEAGLERARAEKPDLILLDVQMPKLNGFQVCRELKAGADTRAIPVIQLTARADSASLFWGKETGAALYVTKPFEMRELIASIEGCLRAA